MKNIRMFYLKICHFLVVKFSVYLNRHVFVMHVKHHREAHIIITIIIIIIIIIKKKEEKKT